MECLRGHQMAGLYQLLNCIVQKAIFFPFLPHGFETLDLRKKKKDPFALDLGTQGNKLYAALRLQQHEHLFDAKKKRTCSSFSYYT